MKRRQISPKLLKHRLRSKIASGSPSGNQANSVDEDLLRSDCCLHQLITSHIAVIKHAFSRSKNIIFLGGGGPTAAAVGTKRLPPTCRGWSSGPACGPAANNDDECSGARFGPVIAVLESPDSATKMPGCSPVQAAPVVPAPCPDDGLSPGSGRSSKAHLANLDLDSGVEHHEDHVSNCSRESPFLVSSGRMSLSCARSRP